jgi:anti-sigma factor RsiW
MNPVDPIEISGLIDGELSADRSQAVRNAIEEDDSLRREFEQLSAFHEEWLRAAGTVTFHPQVSLPRGPWPLPFNIPAALCVLVVFRLSMKTIPVEVAGFLQGIALLVGVGFLIQRLLRTTKWEMTSLRYSLLKMGM